MIKKTFQYPESSFLSTEKDMNLIVDMMFKNDSLKKLLYYTSKDCMSRPKLTDDETVKMFGKQIKLVPKLYIDGSVMNYVIVSFDNFTPNGENPEFRDNIIEFDIICHFDQWKLKDFQLRPYKIAGIIDSMFNNQKLTGIGTVKFAGGSQIVVSDEIAGLTLMYSVTHGKDDQVKDIKTLNG